MFLNENFVDTYGEFVFKKSDTCGEVHPRASNSGVSLTHFRASIELVRVGHHKPILKSTTPELILYLKTQTHT